MRLAVTVCAADENCVQNKHLCKTEKVVASPNPFVVVTKTTTATTPTTTPTPMTTRTTEDGITPKAAPKQSAKGDFIVLLIENVCVLALV